MRWFETYRIEWIAEMVDLYGFIQREHIQKKFGVSIAQASHDLSMVQKRWPKLMTYNKSSKRYEVAP